jgi:hypothetical protein
MSRQRCGKHRYPDRRCYSVLVDWGRNHRALGDYFELLTGPFTIAEAEKVCGECEQLGAEGASVHTASAAKKLFESNPRGARARQAWRETEEASPNSIAEPTSRTTPTKEGGIRMPRITEVIVTKEGQTTVQTKGYSGSTCLEASKWLEQALGIVTTDRKTSEYFETGTIEQHVQQE